MKKIERLVYDLLSKQPGVKKHVRNMYQRLCDLVPVTRFSTAYPIEVREGFFFGFHDKCPWSPDNTMLLAHRIVGPLRIPQRDKPLPVGYLKGDDYRDFHEIGTSRSWNWQQGTMLQWLGQTNRMVYNDAIDEHNMARVVDTAGREQKLLPRPVAAVSPDGKKAVSYSFERLQIYAPGYGYPHGRDAEQNIPIPRRHGLSVIDVASGHTRMLFSVEDIATIVPSSSMDEANHYFTHCLFAPSGQRFVFLHRWLLPTGQLLTRMFSCDLEGQHLFLFPTSDFVSHIGWRDDTHILAYARTQQYGDGYHLLTDQSDEMEIIGASIFTSDGHPSFAPDRRWFVTDTYPDRFRRRHLFVYDTQQQRGYRLAYLYTPPVYTNTRVQEQWRCDLHPRWDRTGTMLCFDSVHTGERSLCTMQLSELAQQREPASI